METIQDLKDLFEKKRGVLSVNELASVLELDEQAVRRWARDNDLRRIGSTFVFDFEAAEDLIDDLIGEIEDEDTDDEDDDEDVEDPCEDDKEGAA